MSKRRKKRNLKKIKLCFFSSFSHQIGVKKNRNPERQPFKEKKRKQSKIKFK